MSDDTETAAAVKITVGAIVFVGVMAWFACVVALNGFALATTWGWFAGPFTSIRLSVPEAIGLTTILSLLKGLKPDPRSKELRTADVGSDLLRSITIPLVLLAVGYVAHRCMGGV